MKSYILILVVFLLSSCEDMLEEVPRNFISRVNYYQNEDDAQGAINGVYNEIAPDFYHISIYLMQELHGDFLNGRGGQAPISYVDQVLDFRGVDYAAVCWTQYYTTINRANAVIDNVSKIDDENISTDAKLRIIAEALFLRALSYFQLVRDFGPVPLKLQESTDFSQLAAPREPVDKVYSQIVEDLLSAEDDLPADVGVNTGKASKWAAKMLLAHVYITIEEWSLAKQKSDEVINSGKYNLVEVKQPDDFYKIFATTTSSEDIMSVHHSINSRSSLPAYLHRANMLPYNRGSGYFAWLPDTNSWIGSSWDKNDLRKQFNFYTHYQNTKGEWIKLPPETPVLFKKWTTTQEGIAEYSVPIYRYAEAMLFYAEAACMDEGAPSILALERLNMIKRRAYGFDPNLPSPVDYSSGMSKDEFREVVLQERAYELILERRRWHDLKRTGTVKEAFAKVGKNFSDKRYLWPIPYNEINNNPAISQADQNPGY
jgi:hypothetical protein